jgi:hypothetical protein
MGAKNEFLPFALGVGSNVMPQGDYENMVARQTGFQAGTAISSQLNKVWRQAAVVASMIAQFTADYQPSDVKDDGDQAKLEQQFVDALRGMLGPVIVHIALNDAGANANTFEGAADPPIEKYESPCLVIFRKAPALNNTGTMQVNFGPGLVMLKDSVGGDIGANGVLGGSMNACVWDGGRFTLLTGEALVQNIANLIAQSGDAIAVQNDGTVDWRVFRGTHDVNVLPSDGWPRGKGSDGTARYMLTPEFLAWIQSNIQFPQVGVGFMGFKVIKSSGTYTKTPGTKKIIVMITGGGGAGGAHVSCAGGGGAGATAFAAVDVTQVPSVPVTIGAGGQGTGASQGGTSNGGDGGSSSFGNYATAGGGLGCKGVDKGAKGGIATTGDFQFPGGDGQTSVYGSSYGSGNGGASFWGGGGAGAGYVTRDANGEHARVYGAGGGGCDSGIGSAPHKGGNGMEGVALIWEFG